MKITTHAENEQSIITPDGARRKILSYGGNLMLVQFEFDAGTTSWLHNHPHEQVGYVVSGEIDYIAEGQSPVRLRAGGSYYVPSNLKHQVVTFAPTVLIDAFTPVREDFFKS